MFEDYTRPRRPDGSERRKRGAALTVAIVFHSLLILWLATARIRVKIFPGPTRVQAVEVVPKIPPYPAQAPPIVAAPRGTPVKPGAPLPGPMIAGQRRGESARATGAGTGGGPGAGSGVRGSGGPGGEYPMTRRAVRGLDLSLRSRPGEEDEGEPRLTVNLAAIPKGVDAGPLVSSAAGRGGPAPDLRGYVRPGLPAGGPGGPGGGSGSGAGGGGGQSAAMVLPPEAYNIGPWAQKVIDRIQLNWLLPYLRSLPVETEVRIAVTVERTGEVSRFDLTRQAGSQALNDAASNAVRQSSPFPALPDDLPLPKLEVVFVFNYNG